jgi:hypothetical protein
MSECKVSDEGTRVTIPVGQVEFRAGGNTIWVHSPDGRLDGAAYQVLRQDRRCDMRQKSRVA